MIRIPGGPDNVVCLSFQDRNYTCELISESDIYIQCYRHFFVTALDASFRDFGSLDPPPGSGAQAPLPGGGNQLPSVL